MTPPGDRLLRINDNGQQQQQRRQYAEALAAAAAVAADRVVYRTTRAVPLRSSREKAPYVREHAYTE